MRFNDRSREDTLVRLMTDGLLLAEIQRDRLLRRYDTIIVDEAHERSLNIDFLLGYLRADPAAAARPEGDHHLGDDRPGALRAHFGDAPVVEVSGRTYPVEVRYRPFEAEEPDARPDRRDRRRRRGAAARARPATCSSSSRGEREIRDTAEALRGRLRDRRRGAAAVRAAVAPPSSSGCSQPHAGRRVVLATNVAETSLTVPGIRYVVDPGTARISRYSARLKVQRLPIEPISQASADQRKGRCGRAADGICIRLYTRRTSPSARASPTPRSCARTSPR